MSILPEYKTSKTIVFNVLLILHSSITLCITFQMHEHPNELNHRINIYFFTVLLLIMPVGRRK